MTIANSGHDERGLYSGGKAGDQTGSEWQVRSWYNRPWNCVARYENEKVAKDIALLAKHAANNDKIGYDQSQRTTFWKCLKAVKDFDPANIKTACEADCSAGVAAIVKAVGNRQGLTKLKLVSEHLYTGNERSLLKAAGFKILTDEKYLTNAAYLKAGDILINDSHHTAINLTTGNKANESAKKAYAGTFPKIPNRGYFKTGDKGTQVKRLQKFLNWYGGYDLVVDGEIGSKTISAVKKFQKSVGITVDGQFGKNSLTKAKAVKK